MEIEDEDSVLSFPDLPEARLMTFLEATFFPAKENSNRLSLSINFGSHCSASYS